MSLTRAPFASVSSSRRGSSPTSLALLRMRDVFHQLHPAGLVSGPALLLVLLAAIGTGSAEILTSAALVFVFLLVTSSLSNHAVTHAARQGRSRVESPASERGRRTSASS